jgi:hypothetical protein
MIASKKTSIGAEKSAKANLLNLGASAGRHGPLAACKVLIPAKVSREAALGLALIAAHVGVKRAPLLAMVAEQVARIEPERLHQALATLQQFEPRRRSVG